MVRLVKTSILNQIALKWVVSRRRGWLQSPHHVIQKIAYPRYNTKGSLSSGVFERRTSTGSGVFALFGRDFEQILGQIVSLRVKALSNTNLVASRHIKSEKGPLPVNVRRSKTFLHKLPMVNRR